MKEHVRRIGPMPKVLRWKVVAATGILFLILPQCSSSQVQKRLELTTEQLVIEVDGRQAKRIAWRGSDQSILAFSPEVQQGIRCEGGEFYRFEPEAEPVQQPFEHPEFGPGTLMRFRGKANQGGVTMERRTELFVADRYPDVLITKSWYTNRSSRPVTIERVYSQRILLDRSLADPGSPAHQFAAFLGGAYHWGDDYSVVWLEPGFMKSNFQGISDLDGPEGEGGGMPFVDVWSPGMGVAIVHLETRPRWLSIPLSVRSDGRVELSILEEPDESLGQNAVLDSGEEYETVAAALIFHRGDYANALGIYGQLLRDRGIEIPDSSPVSAFEPYWKSWGFGLDFTVDGILGILPELERLGIRTANLDDGWFDFYGDWAVNRSPGKFPQGEADIVSFVSEMHRRGFKTNLWWYPLGVSPESQLAKNQPELLIQDRNGIYPKDSRELFQLCPAHRPSLEYVVRLVDRFLDGWNFDGLYLDTAGLSAVPPCFNSAHGHDRPLESFESLPEMFRTVYDRSRELKTDPWIEVCICAAPHSPYNMPYYFIGSASDPINPAQARRRIRVEKALRGGTFCVGDGYQVPLAEWDGFSMPEDFESAMGTGAQLTTFFKSLEQEQKPRWAGWFELYRELELYRGEYLPLYDIAFDKPEVHVIRKGRDFYYGIFAEVWPRNRSIELRGLNPRDQYQIEEFYSGRVLATVSGKDARFRQAFKGSLLIRARPISNVQ